MTYEPLNFFVVPGLFLFLITFAIGVRYLYFRAIGEGAGHVQSLLFALALLILGIAVIIVGLLSDLISVNRKLLEGVDYRLREFEARLDEQTPPVSDHVRVFNRAYLAYTRSEARAKQTRK